MGADDRTAGYAAEYPYFYVVPPFLFKLAVLCQNHGMADELTLLEAQQLFAQLVAGLITWGGDRGYEFTLDEAYRPPETAKLYAQQGRGSANSLHCQRLAIDLNAFRGEVLLTTADDYRPLGLQWCSYHALCRWGGNWTSGSTAGDYRHFSMEWQGMQ